MSVNLQRLGRDKEAIARVWHRRPLDECADHFPLSPQQDPELSGRWDSGYDGGGNTLIMFTDMGGVTLTVGGAILQPEFLDLLNTLAFLLGFLTMTMTR